MALPNPEDWVVSSNDALVVKLLAPEEHGLQLIETFYPEFTYSIFGEEEQIFGYKNPKIELRYRANDMRPHVKITHNGKLQALGEHEPTDIQGILSEGHHLPKVAFAKDADFKDSSLQLLNNYKPPGKLHSTYTTLGETYEIWKGRLDDPAVRQLNSRVQIFISFFIEGGSYIGDRPDSESPELDLSDADRWTVFYLYRKAPLGSDPSKDTYTFVGFSTVYRFYYFQTPTPPASPGQGWELPKGDLDLAELPCRTRLSQFVILPPFQKKGNGAALYKAIYKHYLDHAQTQEFTIENPNEAFDDLRDACDLAYLTSVPEFAALKLDEKVVVPKSGPVPKLIVGADQIESIRQKAKIAPRQFHRVLEMYLMSQLPESVRPKMPSTDEDASLSLNNQGPAPTKAERHLEKLWELVVKQRLYRHNKDVLSQIEIGERVEKLQEVLGGVGLGYARLLAVHERAQKKGSSNGANGKRKMDEERGESSSKRARTEEA